MDKFLVNNKRRHNNSPDTMSTSRTSKRINTQDGRLVPAGSAVLEWNDTTPGLSWGVLEFRDKAFVPKPRVVAFDFDGTIAVCRSGRVFPTSEKDWDLMPERLARLQQEAENDEQCIVIFSNQRGIDKPGKLTLRQCQQRVSDAMATIGVPVAIFLALAEDLHRKPRVGMWTRFLEYSAARNVLLDPERSLYVGDAAGRPKRQGAARDHSSCDLCLAMNIGCQFQTPEQYFLNRANDAAPVPPTLIPKNFAKFTGTSPASHGPQEMVLLIGPPGSGKSFYCRQNLPSHVRVNQDLLKTARKCLAAAEQALAEGKSVVLDRQNRLRSDRAPFVKLAKEHKVPVRCVVYDITKELTMHQNMFRFLCTTSPEHREMVPAPVIHGYYKNLEKPAESEGFAEIICLRDHDIPKGPFATLQESSLFFSFL